MNFKGVQTSGKHLVNSLKFYLNLVFTKMNLVGHTCIQDIGVPIQVSIRLGLEIKIEV
jgi:hypothetical protein